MNILEIESVEKRYAGHLALNKVSLVVPENSIYGLLGPNGAGKTTLIRIINGITGPDSGTVRFNGKPLTPDDVKLIGYLPEERGLYKKMKVGEQAIYLARLKGMSNTDARRELKLWFEKFDILPWWNKKLEELSKGMAQKVQFITTILHKPKLLIFDEPFSGFDPLNVDLLKKEILKLRNNGASIIFSTHNMASVEELCDNISLLHRSNVVLQGAVSEIRNAYSANHFMLKTDKPISGPTFDILSSSTQDGFCEYVVRKCPTMSNNDFLSSIMLNAQVLMFEEQLPRMNEIFIETVRNLK